MKTTITWTAVFVTLATLAFAAVPQTINYQGYLKNTNGSPVTGSVPMGFSLYSSSPTRSNPVWVEPAKPVTVTNGIYSTTVGSSTNPITAPFDVPYYLGINVNGTDLPTQSLSSVPYAQRAAVADAVAPGATIPGVATWNSTAATTLTAAANSGHILTAATPATLTLPTNAVIGDVVRVTAQGAGGYTVSAGSGQAILGGNSYAFVPRDSARNWPSITSSADGVKLAAVDLGGQIYSSGDSGATWTPRDSNRLWQSITSSANGVKLAAVEYFGQIYTSGNSGETWTPRGSTRDWRSITSSADGIKLAAVATGGLIYTSSDSGVNWTPRDSARSWQSITSSTDGVKLAAGVYGGQIYTSDDSGVTWTPRDSVRNWISITSSADGVKLAAGASGGQIYTSGDSGATWTPRDSARSWMSIASSADGVKLAAGVYGGQVYTSSDSGVTWKPNESNRNWNSITFSADGSKLAAVVRGGQIYTGNVAEGGAQNSSTELVYSGNGQWIISQNQSNYVVKTGDSMSGKLNLPTNGLTVGANQLVVNGGKVGINTNALHEALTIGGSGSAIELGSDVTGKQADAGKIGYQRFTADALDIVGAGTTGSNRKIKLWNEGGATFTGPVGIGVATPGFTLDVNGTGRVTTNFDLAAAIAQIGFNRNSTNGQIYDDASKAWQMGSSGALENDDFTISSWNTDQSPIAAVLRMTPAGNATFAGTVTAGGTIETTSGGIKFPDGTVQVTAKSDCAKGRYEDNGDGTISDCRTGLIWLKDANCLETLGGMVKSSGTLTWTEAVYWVSRLRSSTFCGLTDGSTLGDWRLPTKTELMSMMANAKKQGFTNPVLTNGAGTSKWMASDPFVNVQSAGYWSGTTYAGRIDNFYAWYVNMGDGVINFNDKDYGLYYVWPVRSGQ